MKRLAFAALAFLLVAGCETNRAPDVPSTPIGPPKVVKDSAASFSSTGTDPDGDSVCIRFDWGDGDTSEWSQSVASGASVAMTHTWTDDTVCAVRAQAMDRGYLTSDWSSSRYVFLDTWTRSHGREFDDCAQMAERTTDGGYIIVGWTQYPSGGDVDLWLSKTDHAGQEVWHRIFSGSGWDRGAEVHQTPDGGYIVVGGNRGDVWLIKTDAAGEKVRDKTYGGSNYDFGNSVQQTAGGGYIIAGETESFGAGGSDAWLIKTDPDGNEVWDKTFGGASYECGQAVRQTSDGGYIIVGEATTDSVGWRDAWLIKTDADGGKLWDKTFGGGGDVYARSVRQTSDGGYIVAGSMPGSSFKSDFWLLKTDPNGEKDWERTFGGADYEDGNSVQQTSDGGYVIVGDAIVSPWHMLADWDVWLIKTDATGSKLWDRTFGGPKWEFGHSVQQTPDGGYVIAGMTQSFGAGGQDILLIKTIEP